MIVYLQSVGRRNGKKNSGLSRRKGQAMHDTPCDNKKKSPLFFEGFSLSKRLKNKTFVSTSSDFLNIYIPFIYLFLINKYGISVNPSYRGGNDNRISVSDNFRNKKIVFL